MSTKWIKTAHKGLRYYEHRDRKHGKQRDRYYSIYFRVDGTLHNYGVGWLSDGIPEAIRQGEPELGFQDYCLKLLRQYKGNAKTVAGATSPKEQRKIAAEKEAQEKAEQERIEKDAVIFDTFFNDNYLPAAEASPKKNSSIIREKSLYSVWIKPSIGHLTLKAITPFNLRSLKLAMEKKKQSQRSIQYALAVVRQVYKFAKDEGRYEGDIPKLAKKDMPKVDNGRMRFLTKAEAETLLAVLKDKSPDAYDMTLLSLHAGLRFSEIASLTWQDVDTSKGTLTIRDAKAGSRYAFLTYQAVDMLKDRTQGKPSEYVFPGRKGKMTRISPTFFRVVEELGFNKGIDDPRLKVCFHTCRHSYASWMIEQGQDLYTVQKLLGHKTNVMTQRYAHLSENRLMDAAKALGQSWQKAPEQEQADQVVNFTK